MRQEEGRCQASAGPPRGAAHSGSERPEAVEAAMVMLVPKASPFCELCLSQNLCLLLHTQTFKADEPAQPFLHRQTDGGQGGIPTKVTWQRGPDPRPPNQRAFLTWQLAPPSHLCPGLSPLSFPKGACPIHFSVAGILRLPGTLGCPKVHEAPIKG